MVFSHHIQKAHGHAKKGLVVTGAHNHGVAHIPGHHGPGIGHHEVAHGHTDHRAGTHSQAGKSAANKQQTPTKPKLGSGAVKYVDANTQIANFFNGKKKPSPSDITAAIKKSRAGTGSKPSPIEYSSANDQIARMFPNGFKAPPKQTPTASAAVDSSGDKLLDELDEQFAKLIADAKSLQTGVSSASSRIQQLEKDLGVAAPKPDGGKGKGKEKAAPAPVPTLVPTPVAVVAEEGFVSVATPVTNGVLTISSADKDGIMVALKPFIELVSEGTALKIVETNKGVSSLKSNYGVVEGPLAIFSQLTPYLMGTTPEESALVQQWCVSALGYSDADAASSLTWGSKGVNTIFGIGYGDITKPPAVFSEAVMSTFFSTVNNHLASRCFFAGFSLTLADLFMWVSIKKWLTGLSGSIREVVPNVQRWFDHTQHTRGLLANKNDLLVTTKNAINPKHMG